MATLWAAFVQLAGQAKESYYNSWDPAEGPGPAEYVRLVVVAWEAVYAVLTAAERTIHKQHCRQG